MGTRRHRLRFCCVFDSGPEDGDLHRWGKSSVLSEHHYSAVCLIQILETVTYLDGDTSASSQILLCVDSGPEDGDLHRWVNHQYYQNITILLCV